MSNLISDLKSNFEKVRREGLRLDRSRKFAEDTDQLGLQSFYQTQNRVRPYFGKTGVNEPDIGDHPDFQHLAGTHTTETHYTVTMFVDLVSSTRLGILYSNSGARRIKNAIILQTMEIVAALDGHVHRIMGDAVLAFFGGKETSPENACIDALNAATVLLLFSEEVLLPSLKSDFSDSNIGIRVGLEYGEDVLWSAYGYPDMDEVTATSFNVDVAAKLQQEAGRNQIMVGQELCEFLDLPEPLLEKKEEVRDQETREVPYVRPNHLDENGNHINHQQRVFNWEEYLRWTKFGQSPDVVPYRPLNVTVTVDEVEGYLPLSRVLGKDRSLRFEFEFGAIPNSGYKIILSRKNHGSEADDADELFWEKENSIEPEESTYIHTDGTRYRGLHYLQLQTLIHGQQRHFVRIGVFIE